LLNIPSDDFVIGFVGRLTADKGLDDLVTAFIALDHQASSSLDFSSLAGNCWLVVAGSLEDGDPLSQATHDIFHSHPRIRLLGWVANSSEIYRGFDVLAFPSYREGLPNVPLEAQLCGVPVVGYAATGTVDAVRNGETGILVPVGDKDSLTKALQTVLSDKQLRHRLSVAAPVWVRNNFDQTKIWSELVTCYRQWLAAVR
jgi:glycosyltransferase involved in cell wall biosynthesis